MVDHGVLASDTPEHQFLHESSGVGCEGISDGSGRLSSGKGEGDIGGGNGEGEGGGGDGHGGGDNGEGGGGEIRSPQFVRGGHLHKFKKLLFGPFHSTSTRRYISRRTTALEEKKDEVKK